MLEKSVGHYKNWTWDLSPLKQKQESLIEYIIISFIYLIWTLKKSMCKYYYLPFSLKSRQFNYYKIIYTNRCNDNYRMLRFG